MNELTIFERDGRVLVNSRDVALKTGKSVGNIHERIDNILKTNPDQISDRGWFIEAPYLDAQGQERRSIDMTKDGFTLIAMGWNGAKWIKAKIQWIGQFNRMEAELKRLYSNPVVIAGLTEKLNGALARIASLEDRQQRVSINDVTVLELLIEKKVPQSERNRIRKRLEYWFLKIVPEGRRSRRNRPNGPWTYPRSEIAGFMTKFGNSMIQEHLAKYRSRSQSQGAFDLTQSISPQSPPTSKNDPQIH